MQSLKVKQKVSQVQDIKQLVDASYMLDTEIKAKKKALDINKDRLKKIATSEGKAGYEGDLSQCLFSDSTTTEIEPKQLYDLMVEMDMADAFFDLVKVNITDAKARIGELMLSDIWQQKTQKNAKLSFKKRN